MTFSGVNYIVDENQEKQSAIVEIGQWQDIEAKLEILKDIQEYDKAKKNQNKVLSFNKAVKEILSPDAIRHDLKIQKSAQKTLSKVSEPFRTKIIDRIYDLAANPSYRAMKLIGRDAYQIQISAYSVIYEIDNSDITIVSIKSAHRTTTYASDDDLPILA